MNPTAFQLQGMIGPRPHVLATGGEVGIASPHKKGRKLIISRQFFCLKKADALKTKTSNGGKRFVSACALQGPIPWQAMAEGHFPMQTKFDRLIFELAQDFVFSSLKSFGKSCRKSF